MSIEELESRIREACKICAGEIVIWCCEGWQAEIIFNIARTRAQWYEEYSCYRFIDYESICGDSIKFYYNYMYNIIKYEDLVNGDYYVTKRGLISMTEREEEIKLAVDDDCYNDEYDNDDDDTDENNEDWEDWEIN